tara:strand:+ start:3139 stop:3309 length:171 start_codon:yes stop_codon:yes gene_type:complete
MTDRIKTLTFKKNTEHSIQYQYAQSHPNITRFDVVFRVHSRSEKPEPMSWIYDLWV